MTEPTKTPSDQASDQEATRHYKTQRTEPLKIQRVRSSVAPTPPPPPANPPTTGHLPHVQPLQGQRPPLLPANYVPPKPRRASPRESGLYFPLWSLLLMLVIVLAASFGIVVLIYSFGSRTVAESTPIIVIVTSDQFPTAPVFNLPPVQPIEAANTIPAALALVGPTLPPVVFSPTPMTLQIGAVVRVQGVDDQQLNVRDNPGVIGTTIVFRASEGEVFAIIEGSRSIDGFTWWRIQDPRNPTRVGWAVSNYLSVEISGS